MKIIQRVGWYLGGFAIGLVLLYFFVGGSGASCEYDYGPNARTLKNIRNKERFFSESILQELHSHQLDTAAISELLRNGNVLFSESKTDLDSCKVYVIEGVAQKSKLKIEIENCDEKATVLKARIVN